MFKQNDRTPIASPSMNGIAAGLSNFGYVHASTGNQLTPAMAQAIPRASRRTFTPNYRDIGSPTISPINRSHDKFDMDNGWQNSTAYLDMANSSKGLDDDHDGMARHLSPYNACMSQKDRMPTFLTPARLDAYATPNFSPRMVNLNTTAEATPKTPSYLVNSDGNVDKSLAKRALMLTPKTSRFNIGHTLNESLFNITPPSTLNSSFEAERLKSVSSPMPSNPIPSVPMEASTPRRFVNTDYNILNERMDIVSVLTEIGMAKYIGQFIGEEIDLRIFFLLNAKDLDEMKIPEEDQRIILKAVKVYSDILNSSYSL